MKYILAPSILAADFKNLGEEIQATEKMERSIFILMLWTDYLYRVFPLECLCYNQSKVVQIR